MIRSSKVSLKFANKEKQEQLSLVLNEYRRVVQEYINVLWNISPIPKFISKDVTSQVSTWLSARMRQCAAKQASGIVRGTLQKQKQRLYKINEFIKHKDFINASKLQKIYDSVKTTKPIINNLPIVLDSRFIKNIDFMTHTTHVDSWLTLNSIGNNIELILPFKKTAPLNKFLVNGLLKSSITLSEKNVTFSFDVEQPNNIGEKIIGIDIGVNSLITLSNTHELKHTHWTYEQILERLARRKKGSKNFQQTVQHRHNFIREQLNYIKWGNIKQINIENIKNLRKGKHTTRLLQHFTYKDITDALKLKAEEHNVYVHEINPMYTSQRCSSCGWTHQLNRNGEAFVCQHCRFAANADKNAAVNIQLDLPTPCFNKDGFYWNRDEQRIVAHVQQS